MSLKSINPEKTFSWKKIKEHFEEIRNISIKDFFYQDSDRFNKFSIRFGNILLDFSKNRINEKTIDLLLQLANECNLSEAMEKMFLGYSINSSEGRSVLHIALRKHSENPVYVNGENVLPKIKNVLRTMKKFSQEVLFGNWKGYTGEVITDVVNIGIGGSDLGPEMVVEALKYYKTRLNMHFVSNIDGTHITDTLKYLNPSRTLFLISSKTFTTQETMKNANTARLWFLKSSEFHCLKNHFVAISANITEVEKFGIDSENIFPFWDWVGGRYSLCSSMGLSICLAVGYDYFESILRGANKTDWHLRNTPFSKNIPVILALLGIWYINFFHAGTNAILPYDQYLRRLPEYIQQIDMESNGKTVDREGFQINYHSGPVLWGETGTNNQHSFYQWFHQGSFLTPCDFLISVNTLHNLENKHKILLSHFLTQSHILAFGQNKESVLSDFNSSEISKEKIRLLTPYKIFEGNRPSNSILYKKLTPEVLGNLISIYEHKIFVQGIIWNIFSFDQWGVEFGKKLSKDILIDLDKEKISSISFHQDSSTIGLMNTYHEMKENY